MNGLSINVSREEFCKKPAEERDWMLFEAVSHINANGCYHARKMRIYGKLYAIAGAMGLIGGAIATFGKWLCK